LRTDIPGPDPLAAGDRVSSPATNIVQVRQIRWFFGPYYWDPKAGQ
jgi:hypothetical protein